MITDLTKLFVTVDATFENLIELIRNNSKDLAIVVDNAGKFLSLISDSDIRTAIMAGYPTSSTVSDLLHNLNGRKTPLIASAGASEGELLRTMELKNVRHIPILNENGRLIDVADKDTLLNNRKMPLIAVIMAGGYGKRLLPLTLKTPKPMLPLGNKPLLEHIVNRLQGCGITEINIATHYHKEIIHDYFGGGSKLGVNINYIAEPEALGTAGALSCIRQCDTPVLLINGDVLSSVNFRAMLNFHLDENADFTMAVRRHELMIPYGVIESDDMAITGISERPSITRLISAGIYIMNPDVCGLAPGGRSYDMPELINTLLNKRKKLVCFPIYEYWLDIGTIDNYRQALVDMQAGLV